MIRCIAATCIALLALASPALAGVPQHPGGQHRVMLSARVCGTSIKLVGARQPKHSQVYADAFVNHHRLLGVLKGSTVYMVGASTVVQVPISPRLVARIARTVPGCALVEVVFTWR